MTLEVFITDWADEDVASDDPNPTLSYQIRGYGTQANGKKVTLIIENFKPYFYFKVPPKWDDIEIENFLESISFIKPTKKKKSKDEDDPPPPPYEKVLKWPFTEFMENPIPFVKLMFKSKRQFQFILNKIKATDPKIELFEPHIQPPYLRFFHEQEIPSCGWCQIKHYEESSIKLTRADQEFVISNYQDVKPAPHLKGIPPIIELSFDVEAQSSHGDFPIAKKNYSKLATNLIDEYQRLINLGDPDIILSARPLIREWLTLAFHPLFIRLPITRVISQTPIDPIHHLTPFTTFLCHPTPPSPSEIFNFLTQNWPPLDLKRSPSTYARFATQLHGHLTQSWRQNIKPFTDQPANSIKFWLTLLTSPQHLYSDHDIHRVYPKTSPPPTKLILEVAPKVLRILRDPPPPSATSRAKHLHTLTALLDEYFPPLEGDQAIQIGITCRKYGEPHLFLKHILTLDTCDPITNEALIIHENAHLEPSDQELKKALKLETLENKELLYQEFRQMATEKQIGEDRARVVVESFKTEAQLLLAFTKQIQKIDPDIILGYNIFGFDFEFLVERAQELDIEDAFLHLGRLIDQPSKYTTQQLNSSGLGENLLKYVKMEGRILIDLYKKIQSMEKLPSYQLDAVAFKFLSQRKNDLPPQELFILQRGSAADRQKIAEYCLIDCILCNRLLAKLEIVTNEIQMAAVCHVPLDFIFRRGQGVKIMSFIAYKCRLRDILLPYIDRSKIDPSDAYEGAIVLNPQTGIHTLPISVCDFNSLYPSSMMSKNISHDSYLPPTSPYLKHPKYQITTSHHTPIPADSRRIIAITYEDFKRVPDPSDPKNAAKRKHVPLGPKTVYFVQPLTRKAIIPEVLEELLRARKQVKKQMETFAKNSFEYALADGLQQAYKVVANTIYGQTGAPTSAIYKKEVAAATTATGRELIIFSRDFVHNTYPYSKVVYGDTDSIFIRFATSSWAPPHPTLKGLDAINKSIILAHEAALLISRQLPKPQNLEFEKAILPFCLITAKRYHGNYYTEYGSPRFKAKSMGIVLKRRDNAPILKHIFGGMMDLIMSQSPLEETWNFLDTELTKLRQNKFPLEDFIVSKTLKSDYKNPLQIAHWVLAQRITQRDPGNRPQTNDRIPYIYFENSTTAIEKTKITSDGRVTKAGKKIKICQGDRIETPQFAAQFNLKPDTYFYLTNQILKPCLQIMRLADPKNADYKFSEYLMAFQMQREGYDYDTLQKQLALQKTKAPLKFLTTTSDDDPTLPPTSSSFEEDDDLIMPLDPTEQILEII